MRVVALLLAVAAVLGTGCADPNADPQSPAAAPDFTVETFTGEDFHLAEHKGTPVVPNFWESW